jgi:hypothetical protein
MSLTLPGVLKIGTRWQNCQPYAPAAFTPPPPRLPWHTFVGSGGEQSVIVQSEAFRSIKNLNNPIDNRTRDLPACSAVPQPTAVRNAA